MRIGDIGRPPCAELRRPCSAASAATTRWAVATLDCGFCPLMSDPSTTTVLLQAAPATITAPSSRSRDSTR